MQPTLLSSAMQQNIKWQNDNNNIVLSGLLNSHSCVSDAPKRHQIAAAARVISFRGKLPEIQSHLSVCLYVCLFVHLCWTNYSAI